jgi:hypothetical protein
VNTPATTSPSGDNASSVADDIATIATWLEAN